MARYVLIGGGDIRNFETELIDLEIVQMCGKEMANVLFIGLASSYSDSYFDAVKKQYKKLECTCSYLKKSNLINNLSLAIKKINDADIIYVGGGDSLKLMDRVKEYGLDEILRNLSDDKIVVGMSAGAIMCAKRGLSDASILRGKSENLEFVEGLSLVNLNICPHYNKNIRREELKRVLKDKKIKVLGIEDISALIVDGSVLKVLKGSENTNVYWCFYEDDKYREEVFYGLD